MKSDYMIEHVLSDGSVKYAVKHKRNLKAVYKTCIYCGTEWNVSVKDKYDRYICPVCRTKEKRAKAAFECKA